MLKVYLQKDWDYPSNYDPATSPGHFAGRDREKKELVDEFLRKDSGSILISGARGVGKTSLVYYALKESQVRNKNIIPIVINASQLELHTYSTNKDKDLPYVIIENLIRRLYGYFQTSGEKVQISSGAYQKLGNLYKKAIAKEYSHLEKHNNKLEITDHENTEETNTTESSFDKRSLINLFYLLGIYVLFADQYFNIKYWDKIVGITFLFIPSFSYKYLFKSVKKTLKQLIQTNSAEDLYKEDNSLGNLEYELNELLKQLCKEGKKVIFVIDELDKLEDTQESDSKKVFDIIKTFKNLFTLSSALFVFITSDASYNTVMATRSERRMYYTLFTNRIFLNRPAYNDLIKYVKGIVDYVENNSTQDRPEFEALELDDRDKLNGFFNKLCYEAKGDYFELSFVIRDYIGDYSTDGEKQPIIDLENDEYFGFDARLKAKLQIVIAQIYEINRVPAQSRWHENDAILSQLYHFFEQNLSKGTFRINQKTENSLIKDDLITYLKRLEIITLLKKEPEPETSEADVLHVYQWTNSIPGEDGIPNVPESPNTLFIEEGEFINITKEYVQIINDIDDLETESKKIVEGTFKRDMYDFETGIAQSRDASSITGINAFNFYEKFKDSILGLLDKNPEHINKTDLKNFTTEFKEELNKIREATLNIFKNLLVKIFNSVNFQHGFSTLAEDGSLFTSLSDLRTEIINTGSQHFVVYNLDPEKSKQLLVTQNIDPNILTNETIKLLDQNMSYRLLNIQTNPKLDYSDKNKYKDQKEETIKGKVKVTEIIKTSDSFTNMVANNDFSAYPEILKSVNEWFNKK